MTISSMTGFARASSAQANLTWVWELKSVNGKALDFRLRVPSSLEHLEVPARQILPRHFKRGNFQVSLAVQENGGAERVSINRDVLEQYITLATELRQRIGGPQTSVESLLSLKGVIESKGVERSEEQQSAVDKAILASLESACAALSQARKTEGKDLAMLVAGQIDQIENLHAAATTNPSRQPDAIKQRLREQVASLMDVAKLDDSRLAQEAAFLATKVDVKEELDRLAVHIAAARTLLRSAEPIGRKFDFLAQEFNREANTLCSKANDASLTAIGLDLKTVIDQMREQVQNIE